MRHLHRRYILAFIILTLLFFLPSIPLIAKLLESIWIGLLMLFWIILTVIAIALGFKAIESDNA